MDFDFPLVTDIPEFDNSPVPDVPLSIIEIPREDFLQNRIKELRQMGIDSYEDIKIWWPKVN